MLLERESVSENNQYSLLSCEGNSHDQSIRRVLQSEDMDVVLIGKLKISPSSGKLQLIDATGSIDVVIPELPSTWSSSIHEVHDFTVVVEGVPGQSDSLGTLFNESFLCRSIFNSVPLLRKSRLGIYLYYHLRDETSRNRPLCPWTDCKASTEEFGSGKFHLICVTHKFPVLQKFQGDLVSSKRSSIFAEAIILPWDLFIAEKDVDTYSTRISADYGEGVAHKRCKTDVASSGLCGEQICCNLTYPQEIPCLISGRSVKGHCVACSGTSLHCRKANLKVTSGGKQGARKVLLEFESDSFCKYELLKIGGHYITKNHADLKSDKVVVTAKTHLWSILFSSDEIVPKIGQSIIPPFKACSEYSRQTELPLLRFCSENAQLCSDRCIFLSAVDLSFLTVNLKVLEEGFIKPHVSLEEVDKMLTAAVESSTSDYRLPEGNLIPLNGFVVAVHGSNKSSLDVHLNGERCCGYVHQPKLFQGVTSSVCIHVLVDDRNVRIFGSLSKNAYPTGFGPGVNATFHRILVGGRNEFMLTATSFIVINSVTIVNEQYSGQCNNSLVAPCLHNFTTPETVPAAMISEISQCLECKPVQLHCQVVAVYILVLEKNKSAVHSQTRFCSSSPMIEIPLAGFVLDDGSSSCCCWANNTSAATFLRLEEGIPRDAIPRGKGFISSITHVDKILKQHGRVVVKNYGSVFDSLGQDLIFSVGSDNIISSSDEELLKFVILNSCFTSPWNVVGSTMDSNTIGQLEKRLMELDMTMLPLQNIWAAEVFHSNPVNKARSIVEELLNSS